MSALLLLLVIGCKKAAPPAPQLEPTMDRPPAPSGTVVDGVFHDAAYGITVRLPPGWIAEAGAADGALRVRLDGRGSNPTRVEVWRFTGAELAPRPKEGCSWTFQDLGPYFGIPGTEDLVLASCTPDVAGAPRIFAWVVARGGATWHFEVHAPWARMLDGHREGSAVLQTIRWDDQEN